MRTSLQQIETFYWIARLGGFHAAARHLHLTQPTISGRIQELEEILQVKLFARGGYRAEVTPAGRDLLARAEKMLQLVDDFEKAGRRCNPMRGLLRLGVNESTAMTGLIELLERLKSTYPELRIELTVDLGAALSRKLNARELDIAILSDPISAPHVVDHAIGTTDLRWVASTRMALPRRDLLPADIARLPTIVMPAPSTLNNVVVEWLRGGNCELENFSTCNSMSLMIQLVAAGHAVTVLPRSTVQSQIASGVMRTLAVKPEIAPRTYFVSYLREEHGLADGAIVQLAREVLTASGLLTAPA